MWRKSLIRLWAKLRLRFGSNQRNSTNPPTTVTCGENMLWAVALTGGPRRVNHAAVAIDGHVWTFGGYCSDEPQESNIPVDIHVLNTHTYRWQAVHATNEGIPRQPKDRLTGREEQRVGLNKIELGGAIFGEQMDVDDDDDDEDDDDELSSKRLPAQVPYQRYGHTVCTYNGRAYLWGGRNDEFGASSLLHEFNPRTLQWTLVETTGTPPPARDGHSAVVYGSKMYIFGGFEEDLQRFSQETYAFDFERQRWTQLVTKGNPPLWRDFHTAVALDDNMYVFGGRSDQAGEYYSSKDIYDERLQVLNLKTLEWREAVATGSKPCGRRSHSAWTYGGRMYTFGGYQGTINKHFNDLHCYDPKTGSWEVVVPNGEFPSPRRRQCAVVIGRKLYLFGGARPIGVTANNSEAELTELDDLHVLDLQSSLKTLAMQQIIKLKDRCLLFASSFMDPRRKHDKAKYYLP